ncbi:hypothetical protein ACFWFI_09885 [Streptomyces sp. NPDC060209]|uniref:hypothetical protein n=1 Tax=Streptomyces sp. NPDC060209 TaxID=3347073 RepID=UPI0036599D1A
MTRLHRTPCPGLRTLVLTGFAVVTLVVPALAATAAATTTAPNAAASAGAPSSGVTPGHVRPPVSDRGPHDFGWQ